MVPESFVIYGDPAPYPGVEVTVHDGCPVSGQGSFEECEE